MRVKLEGVGVSFEVINEEIIKSFVKSSYTRNSVDKIPLSDLETKLLLTFAESISFRGNNLEKGYDHAYIRKKDKQIVREGCYSLPE